MHIAMHAFGKITLFFCAGAILVAAHKSRISEMRGLGFKMPITMAAFFIASLSIIGVPPGGGTWSKWYLLVGTLDAGQWMVMLVLLVSSLLNIAYLLPIPVRAFMSPEQGPAAQFAIKEAPMASLIALCLTAVGSVILFVYPQPLFELASQILANPEVAHAQ
jgi:multicomponent Na+:H+ antiporter subunit D